MIEDKVTRIVKDKSEYAILECLKIKNEMIKSVTLLENKLHLKINRDELDALDDLVTESID